MNTSIHLILVGSDEIFAVVGDRGARVAPMLQLYHQDMVGGPISISFGGTDTPLEGIAIIDRLIRSLAQVRTELTERVRTDIVALPGAGDPAGDSPDAPVVT